MDKYTMSHDLQRRREKIIRRKHYIYILLEYLYRVILIFNSKQCCLYTQIRLIHANYILFGLKILLSQQISLFLLGLFFLNFSD